jgi:tyrocidine synthetase-3
MQGLPLVMMREDQFHDMSKLAATVEANGVTTLTLTPVSLRRLLDLGPSVTPLLRSLRTLAVGGAELTGDLIDRCKNALPDTQLINAYGSTEAGSVIRGPANARGRSSIGRPVANVEVQILDEQQQAVANGEVGEMYISAPSLAREYLFLPELTAQRFVRRSDERFYRTGDLGRYLPNGEIEFHGRTDRQVKIRGFRVELREVELDLEKHPGIHEAAVAMRVPKLEAEPRLLAYFSAHAGTPITVSQIRLHLQELLPEYMIPASFVQLRTLPRTISGKVDMQALPGPQSVRPLLDEPYEPPRNDMECAIAGIWEQVLEMSGIGVRDNFVELGGDSLSAARVSIEIIERFDVEVPPDFLFDPGTVAAVAEFVSQAQLVAL